MTLVARFELPLRCAPLQNELMRWHWSRRSRVKREVLWRMLKQGERRSEPLPGRPLVVVRRYSAREPDDGADGTKLIVDCLKGDGMGLLAEDDPAHVRIRREWERSARGRVVVEVHADDPGDP